MIEYIIQDNKTIQIQSLHAVYGFVPGDGTSVIDRHGGAYFGEIWKSIIILLINYQ